VLQFKKYEQRGEKNLYAMLPKVMTAVCNHLINYLSNLGYLPLINHNIRICLIFLQAVFGCAQQNNSLLAY